MNSYPADERRISDVERGLCREAILPMPAGQSLVAGDTLLFVQAHTRPGREPITIRGGDSVLVSLTDVIDLDRTDPDTGEPLFQLAWGPVGLVAPSGGASRKPRDPRGRA
jgi:hypothetical protein